MSFTVIRFHWRCTLGWLGVALIWAIGVAACAQDRIATPAQAAAESPRPPPIDASGRAKLVFEKHCARCHQAEQADGPAAATTFDNILDIDGLLRTRRLIEPGRPDASLLYQVMLAGHVPQAVYGAEPNAGPTPDEIDDVRAWIDDQPIALIAPCPGRHQVGLAETGRALEKLKTSGGAALKGIRFISLAAANNACASAQEMETKRKAVSELVSALRTTLVDFDLPLAAEDLPVLAVRLGDMGWDPSQWDALASAAGAPHFTDDHLSDVYGTSTPIMDASALAAAARASGSFPRVGDLKSAPRDFLSEGEGSVDLEQGASEIGVRPSALRRMLENVPGKFEGAALSLRQASISAASWRGVRAELKIPGPAGPLSYAVASAANPDPGKLEVRLWSEKVTYNRDDLVVLTAQTNRDCNLTVINVDGHGDATVLFPSDSDPDNAVKADTKVRVPSDIEPYQLRASDAGTETFIAVCTLNRKRMLGVDQDFEKQRFSILGNWRRFLQTVLTHESLVGHRDTPRERKARLKAEADAAAAVNQPEQSARTAIYVKVE